jgi:acetyl-CoA carboxylase biotin carboxylase subunit
MPSPGRIRYMRVPGGPNVRDDSGVYVGYEVPRYYDPLISKLSVWGPTRLEAIARMRRALSEYVVKGITTNLRYLRAIMEHPEFVAGDYDTSLLVREHAALLGREEKHLTDIALLASVVYTRLRDSEKAKALPQAKTNGISAWRRQGRAGAFRAR